MLELMLINAAIQWTDFSFGADDRIWNQLWIYTKCKYFLCMIFSANFEIILKLKNSPQMIENLFKF